MTAGPSGDIPRITANKLNSGDLVIQRAYIDAHPGLDTGTLLEKLGEIGLPPSMVSEFKTGEEEMELADYDPETQPPLGKCPWSDLEAFMEKNELGPRSRGRMKSQLANINRHGVGLDTGRGPRGAWSMHRKPVLYVRSTGEPFKKLFFTYGEDTEDIMVDADALYDYASLGLLRFNGLGPSTAADLIGFLNGRIAGLEAKA